MEKNGQGMGWQEEYVTPQDARGGRWKAVVAYLGILVAIPIFWGGDSKFVRFHANQGLVLFLLEVILLLASKGARWLFWMLLGGEILLLAVQVLASILEIVIGLLCIAGIVYAFTGRCVRLPVVGGIQIL